ncbi:MAG: ribose-phosphate pyrophosphokinase [Candidatus Auribacterota bacterium]|uniref:Ribose-phosphate pyrophosphokinase n=1 Tax=Candidatus Auribacter fodinae TaxID=2093366 RepID=A0A3A4QXS3_9BACT|nr:MAG: ribose-phosphate pyrophosphokinase [Candidatus Auribacter fodinae]
MRGPLKIFTGNANPELAQKIADYLAIPLGKASVTRFPEGEIFAKIEENVRGCDVFLVQSTCPPPNENLMELLVMIDALRRASAERITAVVPYYGYARQDRKDQPRVAITAKLVANLITAAGADRLLTMDLHADQIQGFFDIPVDHLYAAPVFIDYIRELNLKNLTIVSPDTGGIKSARAVAQRLNASLAAIDKRRMTGKDIQVMNIMGEVDGCDLVIVDDIVSTAGSLTEAIKALRANGANSIYAAITHPILAGPAIERISGAPLTELIVSDSIPLSNAVQESDVNIKVLTVAHLLGEAIKRINQNESVSSLFR